MDNLKRRIAKYTYANQTRDRGIYPYFREISSNQDTVVTMKGRYGSNHEGEEGFDVWF